MTWKDVSAASFDSIPVDIFMGFMSNSSMNYQITNRINCDFILLFIFNGLSASGNGNTSMCCGNSELIRVSLTISREKQILHPAFITIYW
jgi:hypothetical protein